MLTKDDLEKLGYGEIQKQKLAEERWFSGGQNIHHPFVSN